MTLVVRLLIGAGAVVLLSLTGLVLALREQRRRFHEMAESLKPQTPEKGGRP